ncbi:MAG: hypothetical protein ACM3JD_14620 [Rudaea sp.]
MPLYACDSVSGAALDAAALEDAALDCGAALLLEEAAVVGAVVGLAAALLDAGLLVEDPALDCGAALLLDDAGAVVAAGAAVAFGAAVGGAAVGAGVGAGAHATATTAMISNNAIATIFENFISFFSFLNQLNIEGNRRLCTVR